jgi:hypothetical protein
MRRKVYGGADPWTQLATRIPVSVRRQVKLYCTEMDVSVQDFVIAALRERLAKLAGSKGGSSGTTK